jgi:hypothetical protein
MELCQGIEVFALFFCEIRELDADPQTTVSPRTDISQFAAEVHGEKNAGAHDVLGRHRRQEDAGAGGGHVDDTALVPLFIGVLCEHALGAPVCELARQESPNLLHVHSAYPGPVRKLSSRAIGANHTEVM